MKKANYLIQDKGGKGKENGSGGGTASSKQKSLTE